MSDILEYVSDRFSRASDVSDQSLMRYQTRNDPSTGLLSLATQVYIRLPQASASSSTSAAVAQR